MNFVIGVDGIDNSGKSSTIESIIERIQGEGFSANIAPKRIKLEKRFPNSLEERKKWYQGGNAKEIIDVNLSSALKRNEALKNMDEDIIIESRGYITIFSSMIALSMYWLNVDYNEGREIVEKINQNIGYYPIEDHSFGLSFGQNFNYALREIKRRDDEEEIDKRFERYLEKFNYSFEEFSKTQNRLTKLSAEGPMEKNVDYILNFIWPKSLK